MKPDFMERTAKIIAAVRTRTCIDELDTEVLEDIIQAELVEYYNEAYTYGHTTGYDDGYTAGKSSLEGDVDSAYDEGYALGYSDGRSEVEHE